MFFFPVISAVTAVYVLAAVLPAVFTTGDAEAVPAPSVQPIRKVAVKIVLVLLINRSSPS